MTKFKFEITQAGYSNITIEADDGIIIDDWRELSSATCMIITGGSFKRHADRTIFGRDGTPVLTLDGDPLGSDTTGAATLDLPDTDCPSDGWIWRRL